MWALLELTTRHEIQLTDRLAGSLSHQGLALGSFPPYPAFLTLGGIEDGGDCGGGKKEKKNRNGHAYVHAPSTN